MKRVVAAAQGDLSSPAPHVLAQTFPDLAEALDTLFASITAHIDDVSTLAMFDPVTSLPNRTHFRETAECMLRALPHGTNAALFFVDLDNFKTVNDIYGHARGDQLLAMVAGRLSSVVQTGGDKIVPLVGRLAGDEFTILVPDVSGSKDAHAIGKAVLAAMTSQFDLAGHSVDVGASIGIALSADVGTALTDLMRAADVAMYSAKAAGRRQFRFYTEALAEQLAARTQLDTDLRVGITRNELALIVQPQISLIDGALVVAEALLRWNHPRRGLLMPREFLAEAEESGLILDISHWAMVEATRIAAEWKTFVPPCRLAINLGPRQISSAGFFPRLCNLAAALDVPIGALEIEVTEETMMDCGDAVVGELASMRAAGAIITIDTAGIGMSSLAQLARLPVDRLKMHRVMIADIASNARARAVVQAMIALGHGLSYEVIATGVETVEQIDILRIMGCDAVQGYAIARPMTLGDFVSWRTEQDQLVKKRVKTPV